VTRKRVVTTAVKGAPRGDSAAQVELVAAPAMRVIAGREVRPETPVGKDPSTGRSG
jgi:hypothetical protein